MSRNVTIAHVAVCTRCGAVGGASGDKNGPIHRPAWEMCSAAAPDQRHNMVLVPVVVPLP